MVLGHDCSNRAMLKTYYSLEIIWQHNCGRWSGYSEFRFHLSLTTTSEKGLIVCWTRLNEMNRSSFRILYRKKYCIDSRWGSLVPTILERNPNSKTEILCIVVTDIYYLFFDIDKIVLRRDLDVNHVMWYACLIKRSNWVILKYFRPEIV